VNGKEKNYTNGEYGPGIVNDYVLDFITRKKDEPFFLYYPLMLTHAPFEPTPASAGYTAFDSKGEKGNPRYFADMVAYMDKLIGNLIARLDKLGLRDNTLILFLGDNGTGGDVVSKLNGTQVRGGKGQTIARGTLVPAIANWPGKIPRGKVCDDLIDASDFLPAFCETAGARIPDNLKLDGRSFAPQLRGEAGKPREWLYTWYQPYKDRGKKAEYAQDKRFKLYSSGQIFDIENDPEEQSPLSDLSAEAKAAKARLQAAIDGFKGARPESIAKQAALKGRATRVPLHKTE
jgi:arylsulfatase A